MGNTESPFPKQLVATPGMWSKENRKRSPDGRVILLDLNYTLVSNSAWLRQNGGDRIREEHEQYRHWLINLIELMVPRCVVLITARPTDWQEKTMKMLADRCYGWQPDWPMFNEKGTQPHIWKKWAMENVIGPKFGTDPKTYFAMESNRDTWKHAYEPYGIKGIKAFPHTELENLPTRSEMARGSGQSTMFEF